jgi:hypothetical protein
MHQDEEDNLKWYFLHHQHFVLLKQRNSSVFIPNNSIEITTLLAKNYATAANTIEPSLKINL